MEQTETFLMPDSVDRNSLVNEISQQYMTKIENPRRAQFTYYDTFDWALYHNGLSLFRSAKDYTLYSLRGGHVVQTIRWPSNNPPGFCEAFPSVALSGKLRKIMNIRALIRRGRLEKETQTLCILDDLQKTVLRINVETICAGQASIINVVTLRQVRGYDKFQRDVGRFLSAGGTRRTAMEIFEIVLNAAGEKPGDYSSDMRVQLQPDMPAKEATVAILKRLLAVIRQNEHGIKDDIDTECLHDFRVAVRRTRSALAQIKDVFPSETIAPFREYFADLGKSSNELRDLDVYLLNRGRFEAMLQVGWRPRLDPLFETLRTQRRRQYKEFVTVLNSVPYSDTLDQWEELLKGKMGDTAEKPTNADKLIVNLAREFILKRYKQVMKLGSRMDDATSDGELHKLRLQCKKLRYLLEFFASLFPQEKMAILIRQLKNLQDNLGEFNDLCMQQPRLHGFIHRVNPQREGSNETIAAAGGLVACLYQRQQVVRKAFNDTFKKFSQPKNASLYTELFA
jgi:CHAD domain-containing protein